MECIDVAVKAVSPAPSTQTSNAQAATAGASASGLGVLAALTSGAAPGGSAPPAAANGSTAPASPGNAGERAPLNFLQLMAQSNAGFLGGKSGEAKPVATDAKAPTAAAEKSSDSDSDPAQNDPDAISAALAFVSQLMASPPSTPAPVVDAAKSSASTATDPAASLGAVGSASSPSSSSAGTKSAPDKATQANGTQSQSQSDTDSDSDSDDFSLQSLVSQLLGDSAGELQPAHLPGQTTDATQTGAPTTATGSDPGAASTTQTANPNLSIGSHFQAPQNPIEPHRADVKSPVGTSAWTDELGGKITWMARQGIDSASLSLSPEHLGPVEVHISVQDGATSVMFGAAQPDTRSALEQALPRLREMFANQGLMLADAGVSREPPKQQNRSPQIAPVAALSAVPDAGMASVSSAVRIHLGLLDTYA
jgi:flagellar hook-length control protein FliK